MDLSAALRKKVRPQKLSKEQASASSQLGTSGTSYRRSRRIQALAVRVPAKTLTPKGSPAKESKPFKFLELPAEIRLMIYRYVFELPRCVYLCSTRPYRKIRGPMNVLGNTAILRTRRQIYEEAATVLFWELTMKLVSRDDLVLLNPALSLNRCEPRELRDKVWYHNPLGEYRWPEGMQGYHTPEMEASLETHIFTRFRNLKLDLRLESEDRPTFVLSTDEVSDAISVESIWDKEAFISSMRQARIIHDVVRVVSRSRHIETLLIRLTINIAIIWLGSPVGRLLGKRTWKTLSENFHAVAFLHATEMMIESGLLSPLCKLSNLRSFKLDIHMTRGVGSKPYKPVPLQLAICDDLEQVIHSN